MRRQDVVLAPARDQRARALREARRTGVLSLPARSLTEFPIEVYHLEDHMDKDEKKWECVDLVKVDLSHNAIPSIADDIAALSTVMSLKLCQNALTALPDGLFELTNLVYLDLSHAQQTATDYRLLIVMSANARSNQLERELSEHFSAFVQLKELGLAGNKLTQLPQAISYLANLEVLRVEENALTSLPEQIGCLKRLHTLTAHSNQLTSLPSSFAELSNMQTLDLKKNRLESTSERLAQLPKLKFLDLRQNRLVVFPVLPVGAVLDQVFLGYNALSSIHEASVLRAKDSITVLDMRDNKLSALPPTIACLYRLKTLDLSNNDLADLPPGLGYLKHLNHIVVDGNPLRAIRRSILSGGCEALKKYLRTRGGPPPGVDAMEEEVDELQLHHERLARAKGGTGNAASSSVSLMPRKQASELDYVFRDAAASGTLDLSDKSITAIPLELTSESFTATLVHLTLSRNRLVHLPYELGSLSALVTLTAEENRLEHIDASIAALPHLQLLRVRKNQLTHDAINALLSGPCALSTSLKELDVRNNALTQLPLGLRYLRSLETLLVSFNRIESLDAFPWSELASVSVVSASDNKLRSLGTIYDAPQLASLSFENNSLTAVPCELGLCPHLRALYMNGNPQRTVRGGVLAKGSAEVLAYLKNKFPPNTTLPPPTPMRMDDGGGRNSQDNKPSAAAATSGTAKPVRCEYAAAGPVETATSSTVHKSVLRQPERTATTPRTNDSDAHSSDDATAIHTTLTQLNDQIADLERALENHALSAPKRFALKKEVAVLRSTRIREQRKLA